MGARSKGNEKKGKASMVAGVSWNKPWPRDSQMPGSSMFMCSKLPPVVQIPGEGAPPEATAERPELVEMARPSLPGRVIYAVANVVWVAAWKLEIFARKLETIGGRYA